MSNDITASMRAPLNGICMAADTVAECETIDCMNDKIPQVEFVEFHLPFNQPTGVIARHTKRSAIMHDAHVYMYTHGGPPSTVLQM